ncbi:MAG: hypothetical protein DMG38_25950 [Acidobacteria bacterium]|nr:MAG: hypothetical protein DMG38_25950 [Acidobacteriota bacterium]
MAKSYPKSSEETTSEIIDFKGSQGFGEPQGSIGSGPYSAIFRVTIAEANCCKCLIERRDLIGFDGGRLPEPGADKGGLSGGPVLLVDTLDFPLIGVVTDRCEMSLAELEILQFATLENVMTGANG